MHLARNLVSRLGRTVRAHPPRRLSGARRITKCPTARLQRKLGDTAHRRWSRLLHMPAAMSTFQRPRFFRLPLFPPPLFSPLLHRRFCRRRFFRPQNQTLKPTQTNETGRDQDEIKNKRNRCGDRNQHQRNSRNHRRDQNQPQETETVETTATTANDADATQTETYETFDSPARPQPTQHAPQAKRRSQALRRSKRLPRNHPHSCFLVTLSPPRR